MITKRIRIPVLQTDNNVLWIEFLSTNNDDANVKAVRDYAMECEFSTEYRHIAWIEADIPIPEPVVVRDVTVTTVEPNP